MRTTFADESEIRSGYANAMETLLNHTVDNARKHIDELFPALIPGITEARARGIVLAGHYCVADNLRELSYEGIVEQQCLEAGIRLVQLAQEHGTFSRLVLWVNDIGIDTNQRAKLKQSYTLPIPYQRIFDKYRFDSSQVEVMFESTMRNKSSTRIRKIERQNLNLIRRVPSSRIGLVRCIDDYQCEADGQLSRESFVIRGSDGRDLVLKEDSHPKCCLILGTLFSEVTKRFDATYIVNIFNNIYAARLGHGEYVARAVYQLRLPIWNFCINE